MPVKTPKGKGNKTPKKADNVADQKEEVEDVEVANNDVKETPKAGKAKAKETPKATPAKKDVPKATPVKETPKTKAKAQAPPKKEESSESESESDSEGSSEEETPKAVTKKADTQKSTPAKKETPKATPAKKETKAEEKTPKAKATPAKAPEPEESDDEESGSDESESEEEEKEAMEVDNSKKRSAPETATPAKNQKTESFQTPNTATNAANGDSERKVLFVGNLSFNTTQDSLTEQLAGLDVHPVEIRIAMNNGQCKGFAHIEFNSQQEIQSAVEKLDGFEIDGRNIRVEISEAKKPQQERGATRVLFVGQLNYDSTIESVQEAFTGFGCPPQSVRIISNEDGSSRGFGYVEFNTAEEAQEAIKYNGYEIDGRQVKLDFAEDKRNGGGRGGFGGGRGGFGGRGGRGGFGGGRGGRGGRGGDFGGRGGRGGDFGGRGGRGFGGRGGRGGRGGDFGGRGGRGGRGDFAGKRITFS